MSIGYASNVAKLIDDPVEAIRCNAYNAMLNIAEIPAGCGLLIKLDLCKVLIDKLVNEKVEKILILIHELIRRLLYEENGT
jgi:hypothetical protein